MGQPGCPIERAADVLSGKWTLLILRELFTGTQRFGTLRAALPGISPKTLTERLRILEEQGILRRTIYPEIPPRVEYTLTDLGQTLAPIIAAMRAWGEQWAPQLVQRPVPVGDDKGTLT
ncbi:MAG: winged helix-turn-helix transcriptional regulator [Roseiflexaceae bacterium]